MLVLWAQLLTHRGTKTLTAKALLGLHTYLELCGVDSNEAAHRFGLDWNSADVHDSRITFRSFQNVLAYGAAQSGDGAFGLRYSQAERPTCTDMYHYILSNAPTLRDFLKARAGYSGLVTNAYRTAIAEHHWGATYTWSYPEDTECSEQVSGYLAGLLVGRIRSRFDCQDWFPLEVAFRHRKPLDFQTFEEFFGSNIRYQAKACSVSFDLETLNRRSPNADVHLFNALTTVVQTRTDNVPAKSADFREILRQHIFRRMHEGFVSEVVIAKDIGISTRSMQRRLSGLQTTFRSQLNKTRRAEALVLLSETEMEFTDIALVLGFSELSAFSRAVKNWFGQTPTEVRKAAKDHADKQ